MNFIWSDQIRIAITIAAQADMPLRQPLDKHQASFAGAEGSSGACAGHPNATSKGRTLNIIVCVKYVPDATADRRFEDDNTVDRVGVDGLLSELDEYAVEQSLQIKEKLGDDSPVTVLTVGPEQASNAVRKALQMGADKGVHVFETRSPGRAR